MICDIVNQTSNFINTESPLYYLNFSTHFNNPKCVSPSCTSLNPKHISPKNIVLCEESNSTDTHVLVPITVPIKSGENDYHGDVGLNNITSPKILFNMNPQDDVCHLSCDPLTPANCKLNVFATIFTPSTHYVTDKECDTESELTSNTSLSINEVRRKYSNKIILAHININSIRNKFEMLCEFIDGNIDILLISETKIDESFPSSQFFIPGFSTPFRYDRSGNAGGLLFYVRQDIPAKIIKTDYIIQIINHILFSP